MSQEKYKNLKEGIVVYSEPTQIFYKVQRGILMKFCTYAGAERGWEPSAYRGTFRHMKKANKTQLRELV